MVESQMERKMFLLKVKSSMTVEYKKDHASVWPDMLAALTRHGWHNYSIFMRKDGLLILYVETPSFEKALAGMQNEEVNTRW